MNCQNQCVISLSKLTLPENTQPKKLTLSIRTSFQEIFIQNHKNVKNNKINFYRQSIFLTSFPQQIFFNLYQIDNLGNKFLIKQLKTASSDLRQINLRPTTFRTSDQGYVLDWESWIFTQNQQEFNQFTQRDYSQLDLTFENETNRSAKFKDPNILKQKVDRGHKPLKRRSSSTDSSLTPDPKRPFGLHNGESPGRANVIASKSKSSNKYRNTIKSHFYIQLTKIAYQLFSRSSS